jgi:hypothetical protein
MPYQLVASLAVAALVFPLAPDSSVPTLSQGSDTEGQPMNKVRDLFPILPPVPTADPAVRSEKKLRVPNQLRVRRLGRHVGVEAVPGALKTVKISVGKDMVTGLRYETSVYHDGKLVLSGPGGIQSSADAIYTQVGATVGELGSKDFQPGEEYQVKLLLTLFETDIPPQHHWAPETGRYKPLWSTTLTLAVRAGGLPVGRWKIEFANGVKEVCEVRQDGTASVTEPLRTSTGKAEVKGGSLVIVFQDDRVERWTPVGERMVVEHWYPGAQFPAGTPVLGIAEVVK